MGSFSLSIAVFGKSYIGLLEADEKNDQKVDKDDDAGGKTKTKRKRKG